MGESEGISDEKKQELLRNWPTIEGDYAEAYQRFNHYINTEVVPSSEKEVYFLIHLVEGHPELNRLVTGVWSTYEGAKIAFDYYKKSRPEFSYGIASYPIYEKNEGLF